jgi:hypothetical protein
MTEINLYNLPFSRITLARAQTDLMILMPVKSTRDALILAGYQNAPRPSKYLHDLAWCIGQSQMFYDQLAAEIEQAA